MTRFSYICFHFFLFPCIRKNDRFQLKYANILCIFSQSPFKCFKSKGLSMSLYSIENIVHKCQRKRRLNINNHQIMIKSLSNFTSGEQVYSSQKHLQINGIFQALNSYVLYLQSSGFLTLFGWRSLAAQFLIFFISFVNLNFYTGDRDSFFETPLLTHSVINTFFSRVFSKEGDKVLLLIIPSLILKYATKNLECMVCNLKCICCPKKTYVGKRNQIMQTPSIGALYLYLLGEAFFVCQPHSWQESSSQPQMLTQGWIQTTSACDVPKS